MKLNTLILVAVMSIPTAAMAQRSSTTRPSGMMNRADREANRARRDGPGPGMNQGGRFTPQELEDATTFMKEKLPNHYLLYSKMPAQMPFRNNVFVPRMVNRYRNLMRMQEQNPEAYQAMLRQAQFEDTALGLAQKIREGNTAAADQLRDVIRDMVETSLKERQERIEKLKQQLAEQEKKLADDQENKDQLITDQIVKAQAEYDRAFKGKDRSAGNDGQEINAMKK